MSERGGVLLRYRDDDGEAALAFIPADVATRLTALTALTEVPGASPPVVGIALANGAIVTVLDIGGARPPPPAPVDEWPVPGSSRAVLCNLGSIEVAITGGTVVTTGLFQAAPGGEGVFWRGELVPVLDVRALYAQAETAIWAERATARPSLRPGSYGPPPPSSAPFSSPRDPRGEPR